MDGILACLIAQVEAISLHLSSTPKKTSRECYTIEFQKRSLSHAHILIILADECKQRDPSDYYNIVFDEIPDNSWF